VEGMAHQEERHPAEVMAHQEAHPLEEGMVEPLEEDTVQLSHQVVMVHSTQAATLLVDSTTNRLEVHPQAQILNSGNGSLQSILIAQDTSL